MKLIRFLFCFCFLLSMIVGLSSCSTNNSDNPSQDKSLVDRIAFFSDRGGSTQVYEMTPDGKETTLLTFQLPVDVKIASLQWSAAAQSWAFSGVIGGMADIYVASKDGKSVANITNTPSFFEDDPTFSPDGKRIAYLVSAGTTSTKIFTSKVDGSEILPLSKDPVYENSPRWLKDNQSFLLLSAKMGSSNVFKASIDGKQFEDLSKGKGLDTDLSLAENNSVFTLISDREGGRCIFLYDLKTNQMSQLTTKAMGIASSPRVSPDGSAVAFRLDKDENNDLYILTVKDKSLTQITKSPKTNKYSISWSADGQKVLYTADNNGQLDVFLSDISGNSVNLTNNPANDYGAFWIRVKP